MAEPQNQPTSPTEELRRRLTRELDLVRLLESTAVVSNDSDDSETALQEHLELLGRYLNAPIAHVYMINAEKSALASPGIWRFSDSSVEECARLFVESTRETGFTAGMGFVGRVYATRTSEWVEDVSSLPHFTRAAEAAASGIRSAIAIPVSMRDEIVAVLEFFFFDVRKRDEHLLGALSQVGTNLGRVMEREGARRRLEENEARLRLVLEHLPIGVWILDTDGVIRMGNPAGRRIWNGAAPEEPRGWWKQSGKPIGKKEWGGYRAVHDGETCIDELIEIEPFGAQRKVILHSTIPVRNARGRIIGALITDEDITDRHYREVRDRILASAGRHLVQFRNARRLIDQIARDSVPSLADFCVIHVDLPFGPATAARHARPRQGDHLKDAARNDKIHVPEPILHRGGGAIPFLPDADEYELRSCSGAPLTLGERTIGYVMLGTTRADSNRVMNQEDHDVVEQLAWRISLALESKHLHQVAKEAVRARDAVLAIVSHDLKSPLSAIKLNSSLLERLLCRDDAAPRAWEKCRPLTGSIERAATRMKRMIGDLTDLSAIESGRLSIHPAENSVAGLIEEVGRMFAAEARKKGIRLETRMNDDGPRTAVFDHDRLVQVLFNLVGNAMKFTPQGGTVRVEGRTDGGTVEISVSDTGPGIHSSDLPHLFEQFWQAESARKLGRGLGLFISRGIVEAHGGEINARSEPGEGTTLTISFRRQGFQMPGLARRGGGHKKTGSPLSGDSRLQWRD